jgi:hypothetical protein
MIKNSFLLSTIFYCVVLCSFTQLHGTEINKTYPKKEYVELKAILGSCEVIKSEDDMIHINLIYSFKDEEFHADFSESDDKLSLEEEFSNKSPQGKSLWIISIPENTKISFKSGTGNFSAEGVESEIKVETGTGSITINEVSGYFEVSTGTGSIEIRDIIIEGSSKFNSGTGNVSITLSRCPDQDISVTSGTGNAILDYQGNPLKGFFKFGAIQDRGRIVSPVKFENEDTIPNGNLYNEIKSFRIDGEDEPRINIMTGTGLAKLVE